MTRTVLSAVLALALSGATVTATLIVSMDLRQVVSDATVIVRGHVTDVRGVVVPGGGIDSIVTIGVDETIKGTATNFLSIRLPGGQVGSTRMVMVGAPALKERQEAVLFLKPGPDNTLRPVGLTAGVFVVQLDPKTGRAAVAAPAVSGSSAAGRSSRTESRSVLMPVTEFQSMVKLVIAAPKAGRRGGGE